MKTPPTARRVRTEAGHVYEADAVIGCRRRALQDSRATYRRRRAAGVRPRRLSRGAADRPDAGGLALERGGALGRPEVPHGALSAAGLAVLQSGRDLRHRHQKCRQQRARQPRGNAVRFGKIVQRARNLLEVPNEWRRWVLGDRDPIGNWTDGRVTLIGRRRAPDASILRRRAPAWPWRTQSALPTSSKDHQGDFAAAFPAYQDDRILRAYRVVLGSRYLGRALSRRGVERRRNASVLERQIGRANSMPACNGCTAERACRRDRHVKRVRSAGESWSIA